MRTQPAAYREEICRLRHANDALAESSRTLLDAVTPMRMEHATGMQRPRGEMAPGFGWPDPDQSALVERYKTRVGELEAEARALRRRYEHQNLSGKTEYARRRSRVSGDMAREAGRCGGGRWGKVVQKDRSARRAHGMQPFKQASQEGLARLCKVRQLRGAPHQAGPAPVQAGK